MTYLKMLHLSYLGKFSLFFKNSNWAYTEVHLWERQKKIGLQLDPWQEWNACELSYTHIDLSLQSSENLPYTQSQCCHQAK